VAEFREGDRPILVALSDWCARQSRLDRYDFARPMDIGGRGTSGHSQALTRLVKLGLVERRRRTDTGRYILVRSRVSWEYRVTAKGVAFLNTNGAAAGAAATSSAPLVATTSIIEGAAGVTVEADGE
jgi:hypothetical protein